MDALTARPTRQKYKNSFMLANRANQIKKTVKTINQLLFLVFFLYLCNSKSDKLRFISFNPINCNRLDA